MAGITLQQAEEQLNQYLAAEAAVLSGQSYQIAGRQLTRANLESIQKGIATWDERVKTLSSAVSGRGRTVIMRPGG